MKKTKTKMVTDEGTVAYEVEVIGENGWDEVWASHWPTLRRARTDQRTFAAWKTRTRIVRVTREVVK